MSTPRALRLLAGVLAVGVIASSQTMTARSEGRVRQAPRVIASTQVPAAPMRTGQKVAPAPAMKPAPVAGVRARPAAQLRIPVTKTTGKSAKATASKTDPLVLAKGKVSAGELGVKVLGTQASKKLVGTGEVFVLDTTKADVNQVGFSSGQLATSLGSSAVARARVVELPTCALTTPEKPDCRKQTPLASSSTPGELTAQVRRGAEMVVSVVADSKGSGGDFAASKINPAGMWSAGGSSGGMSYSYPIAPPKVAGGPSPSIGLSYSSQATDGKTFSTNNQASWVGEGWNFQPGSIERLYVPCAEDLGGNNGQTKTGDLCWKDDELVLSFDGRTQPLIKAADGSWRPRADDGTRIDRLTGANNGAPNGEHYRMRKSDGTQIYFGKGRANPNAEATNSTLLVPVYGNHAGEPGFKAGDFAGSRQTQGWRWGVDLVVDLHASSMSYFYTKETNRYAPNLGNSGIADYDREAYLTRIDFGMRAGSEHTAVAAQVRFTVADRCIAGSNCPALNPDQVAAWPDVPVDRVCTDGTCTGKFSPTFFTTKKLSQVSNWVNANGWSETERWNLDYTFPDPGDGQTPALWLSKITHSGAGGALAEPATVFTGISLPSRVETPNSGGGPMYRYRLDNIETSTGGRINAVYDLPDCTAASLPPVDAPHGRRCYQAWWTPQGAAEPETTWFHKHIVHRVTEMDRFAITPEQKLTRYIYGGAPAWGYSDTANIPEARRTWSVWLGYEKVTTLVGEDPNPLKSDTLYYRGRQGSGSPSNLITATLTDSSGTSTTDSFALAGKVREQRTFNANTVISTSVNTYDNSRITAGSGEKAARITVTSSTQSWKAAENGQAITTKVENQFDEYGLQTAVSDLGNLNDQADDKCTKTTYARNLGVGIIGAPMAVQTQTGACATWSETPEEQKLLSHTRNQFDGLPEGQISKGDVTSQRTARRFNNGTIEWAASTAIVDELGRTTTATDSLGRTATTNFTPAGQGLVTKTVSTSPDPDGPGPLAAHVTSSEFDPKLGKPVKQTGAAGEVTEATYDELGRVTAVWAPGIPRSGLPSTRFSYYQTSDPSKGPNSLSTETRFGANITDRMKKSTVLLDGFGRKVQAHEYALDEYTDAQGNPQRRDGRIVTTWTYDPRGLESGAMGPLFVAGAPDGVYQQIPYTSYPSRTATSFDSAGRPIKTDRISHDVVQATTTTSYGGDRLHATPPSGGTASTTIKNALGQTIAIQYHKGGTAPSNDFEETRYSYTPAGQLATMTDPRGITWKYTYDLAGNNIKSEDPDAGVQTATYDLIGQQQTATNGNGLTLAYTYDLLGRKTSMRDNTTDGPVRAAWDYDTIKVGYPTSATRFVAGQAITAKTTAYDVAGRPTDSTLTVPSIPGWTDKGLAGSYRKQEAWYPTGESKTEMIWPAGPIPGEMIQPGYDSAARVTGIGNQVTNQDYASQIMYSQLNQVKRFTSLRQDGNRRNWTLFNYDESTSLLKQVTQSRVTSAELESDTVFERNPALKITKQTTTYPQTKQATDTQCFQRDFLGRLTQAWTPASSDCNQAPVKESLGGPAPYWTNWVFDSSSNLTSQTDQASGKTLSWTYPNPDQARPHAATSQTASQPGQPVESKTLGFDNAGNNTRRWVTPSTLFQTPAGDATNVFDAENRLVKTTTADGETEYLYGPDGTRLLQKDKTGVTLYKGSDQIKSLPDGNLTGQRAYSFAGKTVALRILDKNAKRNDVIPVWTDINNTPIAQITATNQLQWAWSQPYGNPRGPQPANWAGTQGFLSGTSQPALGAVNLGDRDLDPMAARFLSPDRIIQPDNPLTHNPYLYGWGNPLDNPDPSGLFPVGPNVQMGDFGDRGEIGYHPSITGGKFHAVTPATSPVQPEMSSGESAWSSSPTAQPGPAPRLSEPLGPWNWRRSLGNIGLGMVSGGLATVDFVCSYISTYSSNEVNSDFADRFDGWLEEHHGVNTESKSYIGGTLVGIPTAGGGLGTLMKGAFNLPRFVPKLSKLFSLGSAAPKGAVQWTRVGRWMDPSEYAAMRKTGSVQWNEVGTHRVANPAGKDIYRAAPRGDVYVEYDVPSQVLKPHSQGTSQIFGPGSIASRLGKHQEAVQFRNLSEPKGR